MASSISTEQAEQLSELRQALQLWRAEGRPGKKIPSTIWDPSVALAARLGVAPVARRVGLNYGVLKSKTDCLGPARCPDRAAFIELFPSLSPKSQPTCVLEIEPARGGRIRVEIGGLDVRGLVALVHELAV